MEFAVTSAVGCHSTVEREGLAFLACCFNFVVRAEAKTTKGTRDFYNLIEVSCERLVFGVLGKGSAADPSSRSPRLLPLELV